MHFYRREFSLKYLVSGKEMKLLDQNTSQTFQVPELVLMEQAAMAFVQKLFLMERKIENVLIVCGSGNNGGDGLAIGRLLHERGIRVCLLLAGEADGHKTTPSYDRQKKICGAYKIPMISELSGGEAQNYGVIVDALFGTGLSRSITGKPAGLIEQLNEMDGWHVAVDIASGVHAEDGSVLGTAFCAEDTITFSFGKTGQYLWPGSDYSGHVHVVPIGITMASWLDRKPKTAALTREDLALLPKRKAHSNKGTYGKLLVIAGSVNMAGAACLCAKAAYRSGCGLVKVMTAEENRLVLQTAVPEAILSTYTTKLEDQQIIDELKWADAVVIGPGIGTGRIAQRLVQLVLKNCAVPFVVDADALNIIAKEPEILLRPHTSMILTPHLGEMSRLTGNLVSLLQARLISSAVEFARTYDVICVLKDFRTVTAVPYGLTYLNFSGNDGMAAAGSGDVLSGILGSLLAQGMKPENAALGVYVHGLAGDAAAKKCGRASMTAEDLIEGLMSVMREAEEKS